MWNREKEKNFTRKFTERKTILVEHIDFIEMQLTEYAAMIDYDYFEYEHDNTTELLDFFEWYLDEGLGGIVEIEICITIINFIFLQNFDVDLFNNDKNEE